ncbi:single-stranded DNA-binding protein [Nonomuraea dietziae]|uniref:single-stranded DNA-binding protein n=1 Tax=Nonomuraea dietziae TaxID=65515 RepID=UPI0033CB19ED
MNDIYITLTGNVAAPPRQHTFTDGSRVTSLRVATRHRFFDKKTQEWSDGETVFFAVRCWRTLGDNVAQSFQVGHPVVVCGKLRIREFGPDGDRRFMPEVEASSIGHDLRWGVGAFSKPERSGGIGTLSRETRESLDESTQDWAMSGSGNVHPFTGRPAPTADATLVEEAASPEWASAARPAGSPSAGQVVSSAVVSAFAGHSAADLAQVSPGDPADALGEGSRGDRVDGFPEAAVGRFPEARPDAATEDFVEGASEAAAGSSADAATRSSADAATKSSGGDVARSSGGDLAGPAGEDGQDDGSEVSRGGRGDGGRGGGGRDGGQPGGAGRVRVLTGDDASRTVGRSRRAKAA